MLAALLAWNAGNYAFFLIAGRVLGPADYGLVAALLSATLVVAVPAQALQFAAARVTAAGMVRRPEAARAVFRRAWDQCAAVTPVALIAVLAAVGLAWLVRPGIPTGPLVTTVALVAPLGFYFLALGRLQGQGRFGGFALCFALWGAPRPVVLLPLAAAGLGVYAALGATGVALASALAAAMWLTRERTRAGRPCPDDWRAFVRELGPVVAGLGGLGLLTNLDVIVAKLALGAEAAG
ncbi:MAG: hypothetical protein K2Q23_14055, partial [Bryobacteraceae bacterium]|nr:hypothetical protein [Bryobacteraceae bacterium]